MSLTGFGLVCSVLEQAHGAIFWLEIPAFDEVSDRLTEALVVVDQPN